MPVVFPAPLMDGWDDDIVLDVNRTGYPVDRDVMKAHLADADAVVINLEDVFDKEMIDAAPRLKVITLFADSTFNIDVACAKSRGITVCVTPGEIFENTADLTFALLMAVARRIPEADAYIRAGKYHQWGPATLLGTDIYGKTLGLLGLGQIGSAVARRARGFDMDIIYNAAHGPKPEMEAQLGCRYVSFEELLTRSDFLSLHCKLSPQTERLIGKTELGMIKKSAFLINTARGKIVDERALADALINRTIGGAALDVFEFEPKVTEALLTLDNVVMTPHLGASSADNRLQMAQIAAECTRDALKGKEPRYHA
jgi:glyoxylate reductase